jgi:exopolyphosphatase/guanosine-5'-triphosphate,3'-diphosphate pyrophosphatase
MLKGCEDRIFYAVGGTWRSLARLHMWQTGYPLHVMHGYSIPAEEALEFARLVHRVDVDTLSNIEVVNNARRPLLPYSALVLEYILRIGKPRQVVFSALGVREGLLYSLLKHKDQEKDALIEAARHLNQLRSRSPQHGEELLPWTDKLLASSGLEETVEERRLRHAACLLADIGWRAHPDYRGEQSLNIIAHGGFSGIDHPGRAYLALAASYRHIANEDEIGPGLRALVSPRSLDRARILGAAMRVAYIVSAAMPGVLPRAPMVCQKGKVVLMLPPDLVDLNSDRLQNRLKQFSKLIGGDPEIQALAA